MRLSIPVACAALALLTTCREEKEKSTSAQFTVWCQVVSSSGEPMNGKFVNFESVKYDYDDVADEGSRITLGKTTSSDDPGHPGSASFVVGYTLHETGEDTEAAQFGCAVAVPGGSDDVYADFQVDYADVYMSTGVIERELTLRLP